MFAVHARRRTNEPAELGSFRAGQRFDLVSSQNTICYPCPMHDEKCVHRPHRRFQTQKHGAMHTYLVPHTSISTTLLPRGSTS